MVHVILFPMFSVASWFHAFPASFLNDLEMVPVASVIGYHFCLYNPHVLYLYCKVFILLFFITLVLGIYTYIPQTSHVCRVYSVAAIL
jgi:hypothetical protein